MKASNKLTFHRLQEEDLSGIIQTFTFPWITSEANQEKWVRYYADQEANIRAVSIAKIGDALIGYGSLWIDTEYPAFKNHGIPEINDVWILEEHRGHGFGKRLIQSLEAIAREKNYKQIGIGVGLYKDYGVPQKLYVQMGYIPDGNGATYKCQPVVPGESYPMDDECIIWLKKDL